MLKSSHTHTHINWVFSAFNSLDVKILDQKHLTVTSFSENLQGFLHLLETVTQYYLLYFTLPFLWVSVVFMGSEKYPSENGFDAFLKKHGGSDNASTDCERTVFQFDVQRKSFKEALDR